MTNQRPSVAAASALGATALTMRSSADGVRAGGAPGPVRSAFVLWMIARAELGTPGPGSGARRRRHALPGDRPDSVAARGRLPQHGGRGPDSDGAAVRHQPGRPPRRCPRRDGVDVPARREHLLPDRARHEVVDPDGRVANGPDPAVPAARPPDSDQIQ
jgi:hypothetical protein